MDYLLDTCAILHFSLASERLSKAAMAEITDLQNDMWVSPVSIGELACLQSRGRLKIDRHWKIWMRNCITTNGWNHTAITSEIMEEAYSLPEPFHRDPVDRILVATARVHRMTLITTDSLILDYPHVESLS